MSKQGEPKGEAKGEFAGKAVIVTGAASGLGRATALAFARTGADLLLVDLNAKGLQETAAEVETLGGVSKSVVINLLEVDACAKVVEAAVARFDRLDALLNVAGAFSFIPLAELTPEAFDLVLGVNLRAPLFLIKAAMPHLIASQGAVVNVASAAAFSGHAYMTPYAASKAALVSLTKSLAMEFSASPVRINALAPGGVATPMAANVKFAADMDPRLVARSAALRGMSQPEDITELLVFLASPRAKAVHGACFCVDLGATAG